MSRLLIYAIVFIEGFCSLGAEIIALRRLVPAIDRALLRIGTYELGWEPDLAPGVVINEAVELAQQYSTKDSGRFVNGLLAKIAEQVRAPSPSA